MGTLIAIFWATILLVPQASGADVNGEIRITRRLTKPRIVRGATSYHRGAVVSPEADGRSFQQKELSRVAIYAESRPDLAASPRQEVIEQRGRRFFKDIVVIPAGSTVSFPNLDPIFHNVFSLSRVRKFDLGNYPKGQTRIVQFQRPGIVKVYCHLHPNMSAVVVVAPNDHATQPDRFGRYVLSGLPAGEHTVVVWHKSAGFFRKAVTLLDGQNTTLDFEIPIDPRH